MTLKANLIIHNQLLYSQPINEFVHIHLDYQCPSPLSMFQTIDLHKRGTSTVFSEIQNLALALDTDVSASGKMEGTENLHESSLHFFIAY